MREVLDLTYLITVIPLAADIASRLAALRGPGRAKRREGIISVAVMPVSHALMMVSG